MSKQTLHQALGLPRTYKTVTKITGNINNPDKADSYAGRPYVELQALRSETLGTEMAWALNIGGEWEEISSARFQQLAAEVTGLDRKLDAAAKALEEAADNLEAAIGMVPTVYKAGYELDTQAARTALAALKGGAK